MILQRPLGDGPQDAGAAVPVGFKRFGELILRRPLEGGLAQLTFFLIRPVFLARRNSCDQW